MPKTKTKSVYACQNCGYQSAKWIGKCPDCETWNSFVEEITSNSTKDPLFFELKTDEAQNLSDVQIIEGTRIKTNLTELDRVLGGGIVPGSVILLGGDPGIGKSTLILQTLDQLAQKNISVLYATGEESAAQVKLRAERLGISSNIWIIAENALDRIINQAQKIKPQVLVVDSIQTVYLPDLESAPGSVTQVRECAGKLLYFSKSSGIASFLIGHVTKEGSLAGPRILEHLVDTVLYFEGDNRHFCRLLRPIKNRFGSTQDIGVFEMSEKGLLPVSNPSQLFISSGENVGPGSSICCTLEGNRPFLVEIQALVSHSSLANPRRTTLGVDGNRVAMLTAVLEKHVGYNLYDQDIYVNAAGGYRVMEPAFDLSILASLVSSFKNKPLSPQTLVIGEIGLSGEIRAVSGMEMRLMEAGKMGFKKCILPKIKEKINSPSHLEIISVESVNQAVEVLF